MKFTLQLLSARPDFYMISDYPNISLRIIECPLNTGIALKYYYHKKGMDMLAYTPVDFIPLVTLRMTSISTARKNQPIHENFFIIAPVHRIAIERIQTLHWLLRTLKTHSGISNLISDKLEYLEVVSKL